MEKPSSYEDCLRAIGHDIDQKKFRAFALEEDEDAIWILMLRRTGRKRHKRWHYRGDELQKLVAEAHGRRGTGKPQKPESNYENVLRAVGHQLDSLSCKSLLLMEFNGEIMARYAMAPSCQRPHLLAFSESDVQELLDAAYARRNQPQETSENLVVAVAPSNVELN